MEKIIFQSRNEMEVSEFLKKNKLRKTFNFLNLHDIYQASNKKSFKDSILDKQNINFIDGFTISAYLSILNIKKISRMSGPIFTLEVLSNKELSGNKKHFFIGLEKEDLGELQKKFPHLKNINSYNPPYILEIKFPHEELEKIAKIINKKNPDYVWIGIGCPKQNILSSALIKKTKAQYFMNVGAALDFVLGKKKQAPKIMRSIGMEWLYRLITDFKHSKKKVWRSLKGLSNLNLVAVSE
jgi:exopolysaccharide biosynthesis WecB/TagA/CpsF family protein